MASAFKIVDLFAGPGGMAEGFTSIRLPSGGPAFETVLSVESEPSAYQTLLLRNFLRKFPRGFPSEYYTFLNEGLSEPDWSALYPDRWMAALAETANLELGSRAAKQEIESRLNALRRRWGSKTILIGGPPCQAYSLVGRARNRGIEGYDPKQDHRHFLYREFIDALTKLRPSAFVMENVKGMLSAAIDGRRIFEPILRALRKAGDGYHLIPFRNDNALLSDGGSWLPRDFIIRAEDFGIPQARHRVIIVGIRNDLLNGMDKAALYFRMKPERDRAVAKWVLSDMPALRSTLSREKDSDQAWQRVVIDALDRLRADGVGLPGAMGQCFRARLTDVRRLLTDGRRRRQWIVPQGAANDSRTKLMCWIRDQRLEVLPNNQPRGHMVSDLGRYLFASIFAEVVGRSPRATEFPRFLAPRHRNWTSGKFADRFRVQVPDAPSTTVTSHISKDGHYFIHPDPLQCRSLTVREAARLQTFPDDYLFKGNRTQQYVQVGNAVPPYLALQVARVLYRLLTGRKSL